MSMAVCTGGTCMCSMGTAPSILAAKPNPIMVGGPPVMNIMDFKPINILPFGMCQSMSNPQVAAATAAAQGVLTPMPCVPNVATPWMDGSPKVLVGGMPVLNNTSTNVCTYGGSITITKPGQIQVLTP